jgi:hypothetical protein
MDSTRFDVKRLDHLGLVAGFCKKIGLVEWAKLKINKFLNYDRFQLIFLGLKFIGYI